MRPRRFVLAEMFAATLALDPGVTYAQDYPNKPVRFVTTTAGGSADLIARFTAQGLSPGLGQPVIVDNRGGGMVPGEAVTKAPPDGYMLLVQGSGVWASHFFQKVPFDAVKDLTPISWLVGSPLVLAVQIPNLPVKSVKELIALTKAHPGELNYTSGPNGTVGHIAAEMFKSMAGVNMVRIIYANNTIETSDLLSGQVQLTFSASLGAHVKAGKLKPLAVTSLQPSALYPGLPTVAAAVPGYMSVSILGMWAPAKTPEAIIKRLSQESARFYRAPETKQRLLGMGFDGVGSSSEEFAAVIRADLTAIEKLARDGVFK